MKKVLTFIPIIGLISVVLLTMEESGLNNKIIYHLSGWIQAISIVFLLLYLSN
jgi:Fe2+ transport system protein B